MGKNIYVQNLRGILIIMVIVIHSIQQSNIEFENYILLCLRTLCNIAVPIFLAISGYYYNFQKKNKEYIKLKIMKLIIPLMIWNLIYFIFDKSIVNLVCFKTAPHLYYIIVLIQLIIFTPIFININSKKINYIFYLINFLYLIIYRLLWIKYNFIFPFHNFLFIGWCIYYIQGLKYKNIIIIENIKRVSIYILVILFGLVYMYNLYIYKLLDFEYASSQMNIINMFFGIILFKYIYINVLNNNEVKKENIFSKIGNLSFGIYLSHIIVLKIVNKILTIFINDTLILVIIRVLLTLIICYEVINLFRKKIPQKMNYLLGF